MSNSSYSSDSRDSSDSSDKSEQKNFSAQLVFPFFFFILKTNLRKIKFQQFVDEKTHNVKKLKLW